MDQNNSYCTPYNVDLAALPDESARKKYIEQVLALPKTLVDIIFNSDTAILIEEDWGSHFNFSPNQKQALARIIRDVILAEFPLKTLSAVIQKNLQIDETAAKDLTKELIAKVLISGWEDLRKMHDVKFKNIPEPSKETLPPTNTLLPVPPPPTVNPNNVLDLSKKDGL